MAIRRHADVNEIMLIIWKNRTKMFLYSPQRHHSSISVSAVALCGCRFSAVTFRASAPTTRASLWPFCWRSAQKTMKDEAKQMVLVGDRVIFFSKHTFFVALQRGQQTAANLTIRYFPPWPMNLWAKTQNWSTEQGNTRLKALSIYCHDTMTGKRCQRNSWKVSALICFSLIGFLKGS